MEYVDLTTADKSPIRINNQLYVLGSPIINTQTLEQLVYVLDQLGAEQPVVIINPEAATVPDFDEKLAQLIQNNRRVQPRVVTASDRYKFKDMSDAELEEIVKGIISTNVALDFDSTLYMYQGLRARAQHLFYLDNLIQERDYLWSQHCANPDDNSGSARYAELAYTLIPQAQANYESICKQLQELDNQQALERKQNPIPHQLVEKDTKTAPSSVSQITNCTSAKNCTDCATTEITPKPPGGINIVEKKIEEPEPSNIPNVMITPEWLKPRYMQLPLSVAKSMISGPAYSRLCQQQHDVMEDGVTYKAVEPEYLLALGISIFPDGVPIVYTKLGTFKRVGNSNVPLSNLAYWYPKPSVDLSF